MNERMTMDQKMERIRSRQWYHSIDIEEGVVTPGVHSLEEMRQVLRYVGFPVDLSGATVLDISAWDGFFSFEAERRGAKRVVAYDLTPADYFGFSTAKELIGSHAEYVQGSVYDLRPEVVGTFDVVLFIGVLYHLRYPLLALDRIREVCDGFLILETHCLDDCVVLESSERVSLKDIDPRLSQIPLYRFYRGDELNGDWSNWFSPNRRAIEDGLQTAGFEPKFINAWGDRAAYKGRRIEGIPEYLQQTYEGVKFVRDADDTLRNVSVPRLTPTVGSPSQPATSPTPSPSSDRGEASHGDPAAGREEASGRRTLGLLRRLMARRRR